MNTPNTNPPERPGTEASNSRAEREARISELLSVVPGPVSWFDAHWPTLYAGLVCPHCDEGSARCSCTVDGRRD